MDCCYAPLPSNWREMTQNAPIVVEGEIHFVDVSSSIALATVYVRLMDVTLADAPSTVVEEQIIPDVSIGVEAPVTVSFSIRPVRLDERAAYVLMVHVDVDGEGIVTPGDYVTMESFPVSPIGSSTPMTVRVRPVR